MNEKQASVSAEFIFINITLMQGYSSLLKLTLKLYDILSSI